MGCSIRETVSRGTAEGLAAKLDPVVSMDVSAWGVRDIRGGCGDRRSGSNDMSGRQMCVVTMGGGVMRGGRVMNMILWTRTDLGLLTSGVPVVWFALCSLSPWSLVAGSTTSGGTRFSQICEFCRSGPR